MHPNSLAMFRKHVLPLLCDGMDVLEIGPGGYPAACLEAVGAAGLRINYFCCDAHRQRRLERALRSAPLAAGCLAAALLRMTGPYRVAMDDARFDAVFSANVLQHVQRPWLWYGELARIVRPGGFVATVAPATWRQDRCAGFDGWRLLPDAYRELHAAAGLETVSLAMECLDEAGARTLGGGLMLDCAAVARRPLAGAGAVL